LISSGGIACAKNLCIGGDLCDASGNPVAGWLADGTPYYIKEISITINNSSYSGSAAHGLSNAYTNHRIFNVIGRYSDSGSSKDIIATGGATGIESAMWDNTNLTLSSTSNVTTRIYTAKIWYI
jgi:hypothetical protein